MSNGGSHFKNNSRIYNNNYEQSPTLMQRNFSKIDPETEPGTVDEHYRKVAKSPNLEATPRLQVETAPRFGAISGVDYQSRPITLVGHKHT